MFKGFYNLASGMITHGKHLDVISNNMANISTSGFKADCFTGQTFDEVMWDRVGNKLKDYIDVGEISYATVPSQVYTDYTQGSFDQTYMPLDFGIEGENCFFAVRTADGIAYTRAGNFTLDDEGYLTLPGYGRVLDINNEDILLVTDKIVADDFGRIYTQDGAFLGQLGVFEFEDTAVLEKTPEGLFTGGQPQLGTARVLNGMVERSNVGLVQQMTKMMTTQRAYQSAAQVTKMYDQVMNQATTELGRV